MADIDVPTFRRIARDLIRRIDSGELLPGTRLPTESDLTVMYGVSRGTVRRAVQVLLAEGLLQIRQLNCVARRQPAVNVLTPVAGALVAARMPTPREQAERDMPPGVPVLVVTDPDGDAWVYPADATQILIPMPHCQVFNF